MRPASACILVEAAVITAAAGLAAAAIHEVSQAIRVTDLQATPVVHGASPDTAVVDAATEVAVNISQGLAPVSNVMNFLMEVVMKTSHWRRVALLSVMAGFCGSLVAASLPIPDQEAAKPIPGAKELPDPNLTYKVVFDLAAAAPKIDEVNPGLTTVARYVNTLGKYGVPEDHRKIAVVFHRAVTEAILNNETFKARNQGHDNPNIALIREMKKAGVDFHVCGQAVLAHKIDPKTIQPEIQLDLWALTTIVNLQLHGYVHIGGE